MVERVTPDGQAANEQLVLPRYSRQIRPSERVDEVEYAAAMNRLIQLQMEASAG
jgi:hypothetical protein